MDEELKEKLIQAGVDVNSALERFMGNSALMIKFLKKFPADENYNILVTSLEADNFDDAFKAAHTLKGLCGNLSLTKLQSVVSEQTELLRAGNGPEAKKFMPEVIKEYEEIVAILNDL